jgi:lipoate-protein ligase A
METWRLIEDGVLDGHLNMATDQAILTACGEGKAPPTLRLYGWMKPTLTVGYTQNSDRDVDLNRCSALGIPVVQRPTGGRALLHEKELTYSLAAPIPHPRFPANLSDAFCVVSKALLLSLNELGIHDAKMTKPERASSSGRSPSCFSTLNHHEITVNNKKLIGSAQRRTSHSFLQQGSVWIDCDRELMNSLFQFDTLKGRENNLEILWHSTISLNQRCNREVGFQEVARAFKAGFQKNFPVQWRAEKLSPYEVELRDRVLARSADAGGTGDCLNSGLEKNADQK